MNHVSQENDKMLEGLRQLLGIFDYPAPVIASDPCDHENDGYIYNKDIPDSKYWLFQCRKCGVQYESEK
jgi:hypothetical protein